MNEEDNSQGKDWSAIQEQLQNDPTQGIDIQRPAVEDQTYRQLQVLREELVRNQDPSFQRRAMDTLRRLKEMLTPRPKFDAVDPEPYGKIVRGQEPEPTESPLTEAQ